MKITPHKCPSCGSNLRISQLSCTKCETVIMGDYPLSPFINLDKENLQFLIEFIRNKGNLKQMARGSEDSYWVMRTRLDKIIKEMGFELVDEDTQHPPDLSKVRKEILEKLQNGEIDPFEAADRLKAVNHELRNNMEI